MMTKEEILKAVKHCTETGGICENCPFRLNKLNCELIFANYIKENESKPVIKNIPSAESNTDTIYENAQITDVSLEINDHCCLTFSITLKGSGWGANFGGYNLAFFNGASFEGSEKGLEALTRIMDVVGVAKWDSDIAKFIITFSTFTIDFDNVYGRELEIVGNVYDNPEVMEKIEEDYE